jgi:hypothetical protein
MKKKTSKHNNASRDYVLLVVIIIGLSLFFLLANRFSTTGKSFMPPLPSVSQSWIEEKTAEWNARPDSWTITNIEQASEGFSQSEDISANEDGTPYIKCSHQGNMQVTCKVISSSYTPNDRVELYWRYYDSSSYTLKDYCRRKNGGNCNEADLHEGVYYNPTNPIHIIEFTADYENLASIGVWSKGWKKTGEDWIETEWSEEERINVQDLDNSNNIIPSITCDHIGNNNVHCSVASPTYTSTDGVELYWRYYNPSGSTLINYCGKWLGGDCTIDANSQSYDSIYYNPTDSVRTIDFTANYDNLASISVWTRGWKNNNGNLEETGWSEEERIDIHTSTQSRTINRIPLIDCDYLGNNNVHCSVSSNSYTSKDGVELYWRYYNLSEGVLINYCGKWLGGDCTINANSQNYNSIYYNPTDSVRTIDFTANYDNLASIGVWTRGWKNNNGNLEETGWSEEERIHLKDLFIN